MEPGKNEELMMGSVDRLCAHAGCDQPGKLRCVRCKAVFYCSEEHQRLHWKKGGHKRRCTPAPAPTPPSLLPSTAGLTAGVDGAIPLPSTAFQQDHVGAAVDDGVDPVNP